MSYIRNGSVKLVGYQVKLLDIDTENAVETIQQVTYDEAMTFVECSVITVALL